MTGLVLLLLIVAALVVGLEAHHRRLLHQGPYVSGSPEPELLRELQNLRAWR